MARRADPLDVGREVVRRSLQDDIVGLSAELAYRFFLAIFPFFIFIAALGGLVANQLAIENPAEQAVELIGDALPEEGTALIEEQLRTIIDEQSRGQLIGGAVLAVLLATGGTNAVIKALNRAYEVKEHRPFWRRYLVALAITLAAGLGSVLAFVILVPLRFLAPGLADALQMEALGGQGFNVVAIVASIALVFVATALLFRVGPSIKVPLRGVLPGAALFSVGWLMATYLFGTWVAQFADYASTYGILANVAIVMIWFYVLALVLLLAAETNAAVHRATDPEGFEALREQAAKSRDGTMEQVREAARGLVDGGEEETERGAAAT